MSVLLDCGSCSGFVPPSARQCPHCGEAIAQKAASRSLVKGGVFGTIATAATGGLMSLTLMACYGVPITCDDQTDADGDGYSASSDPSCNVDCDDSNADIHPDAEETEGDGVDSNCDGSDGTAGGGPGGGGGSGGGTGGSGGGTTS
jgi:hypothetical protein